MLTQLLRTGLLLVASSVAVPAPADWTSFVQCTREFAPKRTPGKFETIVQSSRAVEKCYPMAPPASPLRPSGESGPERPSPDRTFARDVPCDSLPGAIKQWTDYKRKLEEEEARLLQEIYDAEEAVKLLDEILVDLRQNHELVSGACSRAQNRYMTAMHDHVVSARDACRNRPPPDYLDCVDAEMERVQEVLADTDMGRQFHRVCDLANDSRIALEDNQRVRDRLEAEANGWYNRVYDVGRERTRAEYLVDAMRKRQKEECRKK